MTNQYLKDVEMLNDKLNDLEDLLNDDNAFVNGSTEKLDGVYGFISAVDEDSEIYDVYLETLSLFNSVYKYVNNEHNENFKSEDERIAAWTLIIDKLDATKEKLDPYVDEVDDCLFHARSAMYFLRDMLDEEYSTVSTETIEEVRQFCTATDYDVFPELVSKVDEVLDLCEKIVDLKVDEELNADEIEDLTNDCEKILEEIEEVV